MAKCNAGTGLPLRSVTTRAGSTVVTTPTEASAHAHLDERVALAHGGVEVGVG
jgi:hypothetical protein